MFFSVVGWEGRVAGVLETDLANWDFEADGEMEGDLYSDL